MTDRTFFMYAPSVDVTKTARRQRKPTLASVAKQAARAGLEVARYEVDPGGKINIVTGKQAAEDVTQARDASVVAKERIEQMRAQRRG
jgi:hypothetical protein